MEISGVLKTKIEKITSNIKCRKDFECYKSGFEKLTKVKNFEGANLFQCLGQNAYQCEYSFPFGDAYFCKCPLRSYIARKLNK